VSDFFDPGLFDIDPLFTSRRRPTDAEIEEIVQRFVDETLNVAEAQAAVERLARVPKRVLPRLLDMIASTDPHVHETAATLLRQMGLTQAVEPLRKLLADPNLEDDHKMRILEALQALGGLAPDENYFVYLRDPEATFRKSQDAILDALQDPLHLEMALQTVLAGNSPVQTNPAVLPAMAHTQDRRVLPLLLCLLHAPNDEIVTGAIQALASLQDPGALPILEERARHDPSEKVRQAAAEAVAGLSPQLEARAPSILGLPLAPPPLLRCLLSTIDGKGGQIVLVIRQDPEVEERYIFWEVMFNDHEGIKDCFGGQTYDPEMVEDMMGETLAEAGIELVEVGLERARAEVERAYQITLAAARRLPLSFLGWQPWLEGEDPEPVEAFPLPEVSPAEREALYARCHELTDLDEFESWFFDPEELGGLRRKYRRLAQRANSDAALEALLSQAIQTIVDDPRRRLMRERLQRQAWLLAQIYEEEELPKLALVAADALADAAPLPLADHPFLRELMFDSFFNATGW